MWNCKMDSDLAYIKTFLNNSLIIDNAILINWSLNYNVQIKFHII